ncbi:TIGR04222 domain-containing membrane protein, partial [Streptomyces sp. NPDC004285]
LRPLARWWAARTLLALVPVTAVAGPLVTGAAGGGLARALAAAAVPVVVAVALLRLPDTTRAARRLLTGLRERYPLPAHRREVTDGRLVQLYVALYGDPALALFLPRFSRDGGLLDRPREHEGPGGDDRNRPPQDGAPDAGGPSR